jgi:hypothetical protein
MCPFGVIASTTSSAIPYKISQGHLFIHKKREDMSSLLSSALTKSKLQSATRIYLKLKIKNLRLKIKTLKSK